LGEGRVSERVRAVIRLVFQDKIHIRFGLLLSFWLMP